MLFVYDAGVSEFLDLYIDICIVIALTVEEEATRETSLMYYYSSQHAMYLLLRVYLI
jgi:hypothetical protein